MLALALLYNFFCCLFAPRRDNTGHMIISANSFDIETNPFGITTFLLII